MLALLMVCAILVALVGLLGKRLNTEEDKATGKRKALQPTLSTLQPDIGDGSEEDFKFFIAPRQQANGNVRRRGPRQVSGLRGGYFPTHSSIEEREAPGIGLPAPAMCMPGAAPASTTAMSPPFSTGGVATSNSTTSAPAVSAVAFALLKKKEIIARSMDKVKKKLADIPSADGGGDKGSTCSQNSIPSFKGYATPAIAAAANTITSTTGAATSSNGANLTASSLPGGLDQISRRMSLGRHFQASGAFGQSMDVPHEMDNPDQPSRTSLMRAKKNFHRLFHRGSESKKKPSLQLPVSGVTRCASDTRLDNPNLDMSELVIEKSIADPGLMLKWSLVKLKGRTLRKNILPRVFNVSGSSTPGRNVSSPISVGNRNPVSVTCSVLTMASMASNFTVDHRRRCHRTSEIAEELTPLDPSCSYSNLDNLSLFSGPLIRQMSFGGGSLLEPPSYAGTEESSPGRQRCRAMSCPEILLHGLGSQTDFVDKTIKAWFNYGLVPSDEEEDGDWDDDVEPDQELDELSSHPAVPTEAITEQSPTDNASLSSQGDTPDQSMTAIDGAGGVGAKDGGNGSPASQSKPPSGSFRQARKNLHRLFGKRRPASEAERPSSSGDRVLLQYASMDANKVDSMSLRSAEGRVRRRRVRSLHNEVNVADLASRTFAVGSDPTQPSRTRKRTKSVDDLKLSIEDGNGDAVDDVDESGDLAADVHGYILSSHTCSSSSSDGSSSSICGAGEQNEHRASDDSSRPGSRSSTFNSLSVATAAAAAGGEGDGGGSLGGDSDSGCDVHAGKPHRNRALNQALKALKPRNLHRDKSPCNDPSEIRRANEDLERNSTARPGTPTSNLVGTGSSASANSASPGIFNVLKKRPTNLLKKKTGFRKHAAVNPQAALRGIASVPAGVACEIPSVRSDNASLDSGTGTSLEGLKSCTSTQSLNTLPQHLSHATEEDRVARAAAKEATPSGSPVKNPVSTTLAVNSSPNKMMSPLMRVSKVFHDKDRHKGKGSEKKKAGKSAKT